jgi:hypothetical protein
VAEFDRAGCHVDLHYFPQTAVIADFAAFRGNETALFGAEAVLVGQTAEEPPMRSI